MELVVEMLKVFGSANGSLLCLIRPLRRVIVMLMRPSPDWLLGRLCFPLVKREAALDSLEAVESSPGVTAGE